MITAEEHAQRMELYSQGLNDAEIGKRLYLSCYAIGKWRQKHHLPANRGHSKKFEHRVAPADEARRMELYNMGLNDADAAMMCCLTTSGFQGWRTARGLPPNKQRGFQNAGR